MALFEGDRHLFPGHPTRLHARIHARLENHAAPPSHVYRAKRSVTFSDLARLGVRRCSTGGFLACIAYSAVEKTIEELEEGTSPRLQSAELLERLG